MARFTFSEGAKSLLSLWGTITSAASQRLGVAGTWQAVQDAGYVIGPTGGGATIQDMNQLYGLAVANRNAMENFAAAAEGQALSVDMIGLTPNARDLASMNAAPAYNVRVNYTAVENGELVTDWVTVRYPSTLTTTVTAFLDTLRTKVTTLVTGYTRTLGTILAVSINAY